MIKSRLRNHLTRNIPNISWRFSDFNEYLQTITHTVCSHAPVSPSITTKSRTSWMQKFSTNYSRSVLITSRMSDLLSVQGTFPPTPPTSSKVRRRIVADDVRVMASASASIIWFASSATIERYSEKGSTNTSLNNDRSPRAARPKSEAWRGRPTSAIFRPITFFTLLAWLSHKSSAQPIRSLTPKENFSRKPSCGNWRISNNQSINQSVSQSINKRDSFEHQHNAR